MVEVLDPVFRDLAALGPADDTLLIGVVDGVPDLECADLSGEKLAVETTMLPAADIPPDPHATDIFLLVFGKRRGIARGCPGLALPVFFLSSAAPRASQMDIARALYMAVEHGVSIVNVSAGQKSSTPEAGRHLEDALDLCNRRGILVVAAAGNDGCACLHVPAAVPTVLAVGAMDREGRPLDQSNWGDGYASNGLLAPGAGLDLVEPDGTAVERTGTSYATAVVTGVAARLLSAASRHRYPLDALDIRSILIDSAEPCVPGADDDCARILAGRLNVEAAIALLHERGRQARRPDAAEPTQTELSNGGGLTMNAGTEHAVAPSALLDGCPAPAGVPAMEQQACSCGGSGSCSCGKHDDNEEADSGDVRPQSAAGEGREAAAEVVQQGCSCGGGQKPQLVYSVGSLWFDFGSEARYDAIVQRMNDPVAANNPPMLFEFLSGFLPAASGITFILMQDQIPVYAIQPAGAFALDTYRAMIEAMQTSLDPVGDMQRVAVPGLVSGTTRLTNGMILPVIYPDLRGMVKWRAAELAESAKAAAGADGVDDASIFNFLNRVYDELRNLGISSEDRAINFAATNAYQAATAFADGVTRRLELYRIGVKKSPICRPDSDCWDVQLVMFDPENDRRAGRFYRFTVDVSEVMPVTVGLMRSWAAPLAGA
ncbi:MAG: PatA/PatG family cyanobactin maturation protease [Bauldia sp.]|uniref:PatA/PatG family cyanobactin maturation protease n=1 Tax=Bauldia sp. TaxID=2575872 RepID=UPI001D4A1D29|nr:PatA/PatG family cyanobactin maturation protease [Bauldia sp.]MCB1494152.1 PatA/PatG family cyanobactin maturation protease [Bauldia sp.]